MKCSSVLYLAVKIMVKMLTEFLIVHLDKSNSDGKWVYLRARIQHLIPVGLTFTESRYVSYV